MSPTAQILFKAGALILAAVVIFTLHEPSIIMTYPEDYDDGGN
jgi:hypothetical protein